MKIETDKLFIYGSFDILKKGLSFAVGSDTLTDDEKMEVRNTIDLIGNYYSNNSLEKQYIYKKTKRGDFLLLAYSFGGIDEHKRKCFICKGVFLNAEQLNVIHNNPFFILKKMDIQYNSLISEIKLKKAKQIDIEVNYDIENIKKYILTNKIPIIELGECIFNDNVLLLNKNEKNLDLLAFLFLILKVSERSQITFATALSENSDEFKVIFSLNSSNNLNEQAGKKTKNKIESLLNSIETINDNEGFYDFIFDKNKKGIIQKIISLIFKSH